MTDASFASSHGGAISPRTNGSHIVVPDQGPHDQPPKKPMSRRKKGILITVFSILTLVAATTGVLAWQGQLVAGKVLKSGGSLLDLVGEGDPLKTDKNGRTNVVIFGTSQDDAGHVDEPGGAGMWLTDSIQVVSIDSKTKKAAMIAIPRDLWSPLPKVKACSAHGKINEAYACSNGLMSAGPKPSGYRSLDEKGAQGLMDTLHAVTGLEYQYYVHVNYTVLEKTVDALGGVDIAVEGHGHDGVYDANLDYPNCKGDDPECRMVLYPHNGTYHMDGEHALAFSRARGDVIAGKPETRKSYGLAGGDFDRTANQQKVMMAIKEKAASVGTLANPVRVFNLMAALGENVTMNVTAGEAKSFAALGQSLDRANMTSINLADEKDGVVMPREIGGASVVGPKAGPNDYSAVIAYIASKLGVSVTSSPTSSTSTSADPEAVTAAPTHRVTRRPTYEPPTTRVPLPTRRPTRTPPPEDGPPEPAPVPAPTPTPRPTLTTVAPG